MSLPEEVHKWRDIKSFILNWYISHLKKKWHQLVRNDCWHHCTVCNKQRVLWRWGSEMSVAESQASWSYIKWTQPRPLKFVKFRWVYYTLPVQLHVNASKQHKQWKIEKETEVETLWQWENTLEIKGAVVWVAWRHLHLFSTSLNWELVSAHTNMFLQ